MQLFLISLPEVLPLKTLFFEEKNEPRVIIFSSLKHHDSYFGIQTWNNELDEDRGQKANKTVQAINLDLWASADQAIET